ncbi:proteasome subunit alpha, partial [Paenarthrobacter ureafaciens]
GALRLALRALAAEKDVDALPPTAVEAAVLERASESYRGTRRAFRRLLPEDLAQLLVEDA